MPSEVIRLGLTATGEPVEVDLMTSAAHLVMQGQTRSGKSVATYNLLAQAAHMPHVRIVGCDPTTVLLAPVAERGEEHVALGLEDMAQHLDVLRWVKSESDRRIATFLAREVDKLDTATADEPLILLVLEEYPGILEAAADQDAAEGRKAGDRLEPAISRLVRSICAQSAKAGVRVLLLAQRAEASILSGATRSNFGVRMTLRVDNADSVRLLHPTATPEECEEAEQFAPGVAFFEGPGHHRSLIRNAYVPSYRDYLAHVRASGSLNA